MSTTRPVRVYTDSSAWSYEAEIASAGGDLATFDEPPGESPAVLYRTMHVGPPQLADVLRAHPDVVWVHSVGAGVEHVLPVVPDGVLLTRGPGPAAEPVAEYALTAVLALARDLPSHVASQREETWRTGTWARRIDGLTVGILGWGPIGRALWRRCDALGMKGLVVRRRPRRDAEPPQASPDRLVEIAAAVDALVVACPLTSETRGIVDASVLEALGPEGMLVNVARGPVVDTMALVEALRIGGIAGAVVDVTDPEPLPAGHPLWSAPRCWITPHSAGSAGDLELAMALLFRDNLARWRAGEPLPYVVDRSRGY